MQSFNNSTNEDSDVVAEVWGIGTELSTEIKLFV